MVELKEEKGVWTRTPLSSPALINAMMFLSVVYLMTILVLSIVFPLSFFIRGGMGQVNSTYLWVLYIYLAVIGIIFLIYVNIKIHQLKVKPKFNEDESEDGGSKNPIFYTINSAKENGNQDVHVLKDVDLEREKQISPQQKQEDFEDKDNKQISLNRAQPPVQHGGPGVNFFLRLGAIGFALGTMLLDALRISQYFQTPNRLDCYGPLYMVQVSSRLVFVILETHFLFKHHKIILNFQHGLMWFGMLHLIATNLVMWISAVAIETYEGFHGVGGEEHGESGEHSGQQSGEQESGESHSVHKRESETGDSPCSPQGLSLFGSISPYLYPLVIEFALIAAAILYKVVTNIGALLNPAYEDWVASSTSQKDNNYECHKATTGVMAGLLVLTTMFAVTLAFMLNDDVVLNGYLYLGGDLAVHVVAFFSCVLAFHKVSKLHFSGVSENPLDEYLIIICLAGLYFLTGARMVAAFDALGEDPKIDKTNILYIVCGFVAFIQASFQTVFIIDGFRREATTAKHQYEKPGRSLISFLLFTNLAMWLVNSFQLKESNQSTIMREFYGDLPWTIILYLTLPLAVFFRFHSVVCLSDIWIEAYRKRCHALFKVSPDQLHTEHGHEQGTNGDTDDTVIPNNLAIAENDSYQINTAVNESDENYPNTKL